GVRPARTISTSCRRNSGGYGGFPFGIVDILPRGQVSTEPGQLHPEPGVGPFVEQGAVEAFDLAVGGGPVGPGSGVGDAELGATLAPEDGAVAVAVVGEDPLDRDALLGEDRKSTRLNSSHVKISYAVSCWQEKHVI